MIINVNDTISTVVTYLNEVIAAEFIMYNKSGDSADIVKLAEMLLDVRFQIDFTLMSSATEIQELYDKYRNRPVDESNIEVRTIMDLAAYIQMTMSDTALSTNDTPYLTLISRLADLLTLHSNVDISLTCQDESITQTIDHQGWCALMKANPWLVAMVCIRLIPSYYIVDMAVVKLTDIPKVPHETRSPS